MPMMCGCVDVPVCGCAGVWMCGGADVVGALLAAPLFDTNNFSSATCIQLPGAQPRSTILIPGLKILNLSSISKSL